jgi:hypothetical protein
MEQPGLDQRHRVKNGEISRKHGNTLIATLRKSYGIRLAPGQRDDTKLSAVLETLDEESLRKLIRDTNNK